MKNLPAVVGLMIVVAGAVPPALAQEPARPTLTITRFDGKTKSIQTGDAGAELADALATRVEESGCCRVMLRAWLPQTAGGKSPSLQTVRAAAVAARVEYVVTGRVTRTKTVRRPGPPSIAAVLGQIGSRALFPAGAVRGLSPLLMPHLVPPPAQALTRITLEMRIVDAATGGVLRTVSITREAPTNAAARITNSAEVSNALIHAISNVARERR